MLALHSSAPVLHVVAQEQGRAISRATCDFILSLTPPAYTLPIDGMEKRPLDIGDDDLAFCCFVNYAIGQGHHRQAFLESTGIDLTYMLRRTGIEKAIDDAAGRDLINIAAFADWCVGIFGEYGIDCTPNYQP